MGRIRLAFVYSFFLLLIDMSLAQIHKNSKPYGMHYDSRREAPLKNHTPNPHLCQENPQTVIPPNRALTFSTTHNSLTYLFARIPFLDLSRTLRRFFFFSQKWKTFLESSERMWCGAWRGVLLREWAPRLNNVRMASACRVLSSFGFTAAKTSSGFDCWEDTHTYIYTQRKRERAAGFVHLSKCVP